MLDYGKLFISDLSNINDCERIVKVAKDHGEEITVLDAEKIWQKYSDSMEAGWMFLPENNKDVWNIISIYFIMETN